jgi:DNA-directed RNA polymerase specialized sigma24 family protein
MGQKNAVRYRHRRGEAAEGLTSDQLEILLARLSSDREQAGMLYEDIRRRLIEHFSSWQLGVDSESLADKTIDRVALRLAQGQVISVENPFRYFRGVARHIVLERYREAKRQNQALDTFAELHPSEPDPEVDPHLPCLQKCLGRLSADERRLIFRYFVLAEKNRASRRQRLTQELGIGINALRIRAHRVRRKLRGCCSHVTSPPCTGSGSRGAGRSSP